MDTTTAACYTKMEDAHCTSGNTTQAAPSAVGLLTSENTKKGSTLNRFYTLTEFKKFDEISSSEKELKLRLYFHISSPFTRLSKYHHFPLKFVIHVIKTFAIVAQVRHVLA